MKIAHLVTYITIHRLDLFKVQYLQTANKKVTIFKCECFFDKSSYRKNDNTPVIQIITFPQNHFVLMAVKYN